LGKEDIKMNAAFIVLLLLGAYLVGAIPFGYIIVKKIKGIDIRTIGSGKTGATNVNRELGRTWGIITIILDTLKGFVVGAFALFYFGTIPWVVGLSLFLVIVGHTFSIFLAFLSPPRLENGRKVTLLMRFKGGSGVASFIGFVLPLLVICFGKFIHPWTYGALVVVVIGWLIVHKTRKQMGLSSLFLMALIILYFGGLTKLTQFSYYAPLTGFITLTALFIMWNHRENWIRIQRGEEPPTDLI
jgi:glycerol-3-phosphate acyltransferase PlsY